MNDLQQKIKEQIDLLKKEENKPKISEYLLKCSHLKEAIDYLDDEYLSDLSLAAYKITIEGYYNLYDYIIKTRNIPIYLNDEMCKDRDIYIPYILNFGIAPKYTNEMYLDKMPNGQTILEYLLEHQPFFYELNPISVDSIEVAKILYTHYMIRQLATAPLEVLVANIDKDKTVLDVLKQHNILPNVMYIKDTKNEMFYTDIITNPKKKNIALEKYDGKTLIELLIEKDFSFEIEIAQNSDPKEWLQIFITLFKVKRCDLIKNVPEEFLTLEVTSQKRIIDYYPTDYLPQINGDLKDIEVICVYLLNNRLEEVMEKATAEALAEKLNDECTVLDYIFIKHPDLSKIKDIIRKRNLRSEELSIILARHGLLWKTNHTKTIGIDADYDLYNFIYCEEDYKIDNEGQYYINQFKTQYNDGKSSIEIIDLVIKSFKRTYQTDKELAIRDIKILMKFKEIFNEFVLEWDPTKNNHFEIDGYSNPKIVLKNNNAIDTLNHELAHLVDFFLFSQDSFENIDFILMKGKNSDTDELMQSFYRLNEEAEKKLPTIEECERNFHRFIISKYGSVENYKYTIREEFKSLIGSKELLLDTINRENYSEEVIIAIVNAYYNPQTIDNDELVELYVANRIEIEKKIFSDVSYHKANSEFLLYENFVDAYYFGQIGELMRTEVKKLKAPVSTHDYAYFLKDEESQFEEVYANYMALKKCLNGQYYIEKLKKQISSDLINLLEEYNKQLTISLCELEKGKSK